MLTCIELHKQLHYNPDTGVFTRMNGSIAKGTYKDGYIRIKVLGHGYRAHRLAWLYVNGEWPQFSLDHINGRKDDNRIENLRPCTHVQNLQNSKKPITNTSGYKGVYFKKDRKKWASSIRVNRKVINLGYFHTKEEASKAYQTAARLHFGDFFRAE